ncbi:hypothetical protein BT69DRAFT_1355325 [Atractiella rhizophila]|nr:hypothetical protein BT69DRAFT_1355325 [Atractiella rhizophila]
MSRVLGRLLLFAGVVGILHCAYTCYILRKHSVTGALPPLPLDFLLKLAGSFITVTFGITLSVRPLKEIGWGAQMRKVSIDSDPLHARTGFADLVGRGRVIWEEIGEED